MTLVIRACALARWAPHGAHRSQDFDEPVGTLAPGSEGRDAQLAWSVGGSRMVHEWLMVDPFGGNVWLSAGL